MKSSKRVALGFFVFATAIVWGQEPARHAGTFVLIDMPGAVTSNPSGSYSLVGTTVTGLNDSGQVIGHYNAASTGETHGFLRERDGRIVPIDDPAVIYVNAPSAVQGTTPNALNDAGTIVGSYQNVYGSENGFARSSTGGYQSFPESDLGASESFGINGRSEIVGAYFDENDAGHGFVWERDGTITGFEAPDAATGSFFEGTWALAINDSGEIAGWYHDASLVAHPFFRAKDGTITDFEVPGAAAIPYVGAYASGIDEEGTVIGFYYDANYGIHNFLRTRDGKIITVHIPGEEAYVAVEVVSINRRGELLGIYVDANNSYHSFIRSRDGRMVYLNDPDAGTGTSQGTAGVSINDSGEVAGYYVDSNNVNHGFLWTSAVK